MFSELVTVGGPGLLIPVVLFALLLYAVRGLFGLDRRGNQRRLEFLEHWDPKRIDDDLWLEVTIRNLYGTHLPAHVIRTALAHPHTSQALVDLSDLWQLFRYEPETQRVSWQHNRYRHSAIRGLLRHYPTVRYFLFAITGVFAAYYAAHISGLNQWIISAFALFMGICAVLSLWHGDTERAAATVGEAWIKKINNVPVLNETERS